MKKLTPFSLAMLSVILTACSVGSGSGSQGDPKGVMSQNAERRTIIVPGAEQVGDLAKAEEMEKLLNIIKAQDNLTNGSCANRTGSLCHKDVAVNTVVGSYEQSYSSFAALRNEYRDNDEIARANVPANRFTALVSLPTTDKSAIVDATYKGQISYSARNAPSISSHDLVMIVKGDKISGISQETTGSGKVRTRATFNETAIQVEADRISFSGKAEFHSDVFLQSTQNNNNLEYTNNIEGIYSGLFAGEKGEEVIGTFHTNNTNDKTSVQGAFGAKRQ